MNNFIFLLTTISLFMTPDYSQSRSDWVKNYNGPDNQNDNAYELVLDNAGNIYVCGSSEGTNTGLDYLTLKYDHEGNLLWSARYSGPKADDIPAGMVVDDNSNVYVTGLSDSGIACDYLTVKYDKNGNEVWKQRYCGKKNNDDIPKCIAVDKGGNVLVTGSSDGLGSFEADFATIKYSPDGVLLWVSVYNGKGNSTDVPEALDVDGSGNIFVTGSTVSKETNSDIVLIKYDSEGVQQWINVYNSPASTGDFGNALALDKSGNIYVAGGISGSDYKPDMATIKFNSNGEILWIRKYDGPGKKVDYAELIKLDGEENIYTAGYSMQQGEKPGYAAIKYNTNGDEVWEFRYDVPGKNSVVSSMAVESNGIVYLTGRCYSNEFNADFATIKLNPAGVQQWVETYDGPANDNDNASSIAVDNSGKVFVTGVSTMDKESHTDFVTIRYR